ncbi:MAG: UDP-N-acetylmuramate dehydrogenase [Alphaproteobacteria bacterium]|jgi:UDP-N-acetylmuramate dehydrogenase|uniref:UDP-N-acetylenolpyruvoylglucosamine reductase n=1 Tax=Rickettsiaceae endosymbiont of Volvox carteri TaxID=1408100 RepID=A0A0C6EU92_9RICK|nr:UDP-N-acetylmuramate dehydrogenase [Alphaproteobacteria bacterium]BAQ36579.1 UDP-N-acetylenolpyruvoylglucosamine reductase [Rickettsiaceae endosymbiont of Volvox carteri]
MNFQGIRGVFKQNYNLKHLTWLKVGGDADIFFKPEDIEDLKTFLKENNNRFPITVIGAGSNLIIRDKGVEGIVIKLGRNFTDIQFIDNNLIVAGAGCLNSNLAKFCLVNSIAGFEFLVGIPGTVGGGVAMNAGSYGREFKDIVASVEVLDTEGNLIIIPVDRIGFSYRTNSLPKDLIFTRVFFQAKNKEDTNKIKQKMNEISAIRSSSQPVSEKTGGSTFANPKGFKAWELIDKAGLRGVRVGGACMSEMHCNFMINANNATATDMENLGELVKQKVKENSGIELQWEIKRIGKL